MVAAKRLHVLIAIACLASCAQDDAQEAHSSLQIDAGWYVGGGGSEDNTIPAVMRISASGGSCTATAVSDNTLLTAAHCVPRQVNSEGKVVTNLCINSGTMALNKCSTDVYSSRAYTSNRDFRQDIAIAIFPRGTFKSYLPVSAEDVKVGDKVALVGYSEYQNSNPSKGSKRWGYNTVSAFTEETVILTRYRGNGNGVSVSPGDSGGPMFSQCKIVGVASRMHVAGNKSGLHTNTNDDDNRAFLVGMREKGAEFCGLPGAKHEFCASGLGQYIPSLGEAPSGSQPAFPCTTGAVAGSAAPRDIYFALDSYGHLHVSAPTSAADLAVCFGNDPNACKSKKISTSFHRDSSGRKVYRTLAPADLREPSHQLAAIALDASGNAIAIGKVDIRKAN